MTRAELKAEYLLLADNDNFLLASDKRSRGRRFEQLINALLENEGLEPASSFRPEGEEIDGSFIHHNNVYLFEAKWHNAAIPASSIYQFKGKVDGKLVGTIGIFISMSGFSSEAIDALTFGKSINILLFDKRDFAICLDEPNGFIKGLNKKLRIATEKGTPFHSLATVSIQSTKQARRAQVTITETNELKPSRKLKRELEELITILVEGTDDQHLVATLAERVLKTNNLERKVKVLQSGGKYAMARHAGAVKDFTDEASKFIIVADGDDDVDETYNLLHSNLGFNDAVIIIPNPGIEAWFAQFDIFNRLDLREFAAKKRISNGAAMRSLIERIDIEELVRTDKSFQKFHDALIS